MSLTITINGINSELEANFNPPLNLNENYECGLLYFSSYNSIPNIHCKNNNFSYGDDKNLQLPVGTYDLYDIQEHIVSKIKDCEFDILPNNNTFKCSLMCTKTLNFDKENSIGTVFGFPKVKLEPNKWHESMNPINIQTVSVIRITCDIVQGSYINGAPSHIIHEFVPTAAPGFRIIEKPQNIIYLPVNKSYLSTLNIKIVDSNNNAIDFRGEELQLGLHLRKTLK